MKHIICGYCWHENTDDEHTDYCAFKKGSSWDLEGLNAPNSGPLAIDTAYWEKDENGRYSTIKKEKQNEKSSTSITPL